MKTLAELVREAEGSADITRIYRGTADTCDDYKKALLCAKKTQKLFLQAAKLASKDGLPEQESSLLKRASSCEDKIAKLEKYIRNHWSL